MARSTKAAKVRSLEAAVEAALGVLREDPPRLKRLLREAGGLADDVASVLEDAKREDEAGRVRLVAKTLRGGALLPAMLSIPLLRKAFQKLLAAAD